MTGPYRVVTREMYLEGIILYNLLVFSFYVAIYSSIDFEKHFEVASGVQVTPAFIMYFAFLTHANAMCAEVVPRTEFGRNLLGTHVLCSWALFLILLAPWSAVRVQVM